MTATNQSPEESATQHLRLNNDRKTPSSSKAFEESETDRESYGSSSDDTETHSPKSEVRRTRRRPATVKNVNADAVHRRVRNQIERIRAEDSHLGEDIGECLIVKICGSGHDDDVMSFPMPASPLSGKAADRMNSAS